MKMAEVGSVEKSCKVVQCVMSAWKYMPMLTHSFIPESTVVYSGIFSCILEVNAVFGDEMREWTQSLVGFTISISRSARSTLKWQNII